MKQREYEKSDRGRAVRKRYQESEKFRETLRKWRKGPKGSSYIKSYTLLYRYGITVEQRDAILAQNGGLCAICLKNTATEIDHCHQSGVIRGALCHSCNKGLGFFRDDTGLLGSATSYLNSQKPIEKRII